MVMGLGALAVMQEKMTGEQLTSFLFYVNFVSAASFDVGDRWTSIQDAIGSTTSVFALMDRKPRLKVREDLRAQALEAERREAEALQQEHEHAAQDLDALYEYSNTEHRPHPQPQLGRVSFRNVTFAYPLREKKLVLHGISLDICSGERTAIVGGACPARVAVMDVWLAFGVGWLLLGDVCGGVCLWVGADSEHWWF
jgi:ABC-type multidrug transport system fused ATPase/permease subunit